MDTTVSVCLFVFVSGEYRGRERINYASIITHRVTAAVNFITFRVVSRRRCEMSSGHDPMCVHYWADLQSVHWFRCCDNIDPNAKCQQVLVLRSAWFNQWSMQLLFHLGLFKNFIID